MPIKATDILKFERIFGTQLSIFMHGKRGFSMLLFRELIKTPDGICDLDHILNGWGKEAKDLIYKFISDRNLN